MSFPAAPLSLGELAAHTTSQLRFAAVGTWLSHVRNGSPRALGLELSHGVLSQLAQEDSAPDTVKGHPACADVWLWPCGSCGPGLLPGTQLLPCKCADVVSGEDSTSY